MWHKDILDEQRLCDNFDVFNANVTQLSCPGFTCRWKCSSKKIH